MHRISKFIYHNLLGWKATGFKNFDSVKKAVLIAAPHTSWHDFYIGVLLRSALKLEAHFVGKEALFNPLTAWFFRALGGAPVREMQMKNKWTLLHDCLRIERVFRMLLAPEGTRKKVESGEQDFTL